MGIQASAFFLVILLLGCSDFSKAPVDQLILVSPAVAYHPRNFCPEREGSEPKLEQIRKDLRLLRKTGFRSLVSYSSKGILGSIPAIARREGFDAQIIMGIWDPSSKQEWDNAIEQATHVDGYCLGNEGLGIRYSADQLKSKMSELRRLTGRPVTTSEPIVSYLEGSHSDWLLSNSDWIFPNTHPFLAGQVDPDQAVDWVVSRSDYLLATTGKNVILKETGCPSAGCQICNEETQLAYFKALESKGVSFFYFEAFDQPWKRNIPSQPEFEGYWGLFRANGTPKRVILSLVNK